MHCTTSTVTSTTTHHTTREIIEKHRVNKNIEVECLHIEKEVVNKQVIHQEELNYVYNVQNRTVYQPVNNLGTIINKIA